ncbi:MAG: ribosomal protein S18-alanine N-acetyltransferase [Gammaproteobacteria bacterium]|nr:MAG: ribosomal protein S18-alanine N-acetyltransferase [Gammaproteobacteria bacterium]
MSAVVSSVFPVVRPMKADDVQWVYAVEKVAYDFPWTEHIFHDCLRVGYYCSVLECNDGLIGHGIMSTGVGECHMLNICIHPDYQRQGFGNKLVCYLLDLAYWQKVRHAYLEVRQSNNGAIRLYERLGFEVIGVRKDYYPVGDNQREDALILSRELGPDIGRG